MAIFGPLRDRINNAVQALESLLVSPSLEHGTNEYRLIAMGDIASE